MAVKLTDEMIQAAKLNEEKYGTPASITLGQIILESSGSYSGGVSGLAFKSKNLFGMKGTGTAGSYYVNTTEYGKDGYYTTKAKFRKYNNYAESIADHGRLLATENYASKTAGAKSVEEYARGIQAGGYATDPKYAEKLISVINSNDLKKYDGGGWVNTDPQAVTEVEEKKLDVFGQLARFIVILGLIVLAVAFLLKGLGVKGVRK